LVTMATSTILNFINMSKASTNYGEYSYDVSWSLMKEINFFLNLPFFISMATVAKFVLPIPIFVCLSRSTRCECDRKHYIKNLWSLEWIKHFLHLGYHGNGHHFEFVQPPKSCHTLRWIFLQCFMKFDERNPKIF
jgi:hypothetical protein